MKPLTTILFFVTLSLCLEAQPVRPSKSALVFSAIKGEASKTDTLWLTSSDKNFKPGALAISGKQSSYFQVLSKSIETLETNKPVPVEIVFKPAFDFIGIARAVLSNKKAGIEIPLTGLSTKGLEGENEAPLAEIVEALGYQIDLGWTTLANHVSPDPQGEEIPPALFKKAGEGMVEMIPVARYSPDFPVNFGYYTASPNGPVHDQAGILSRAGSHPEHQTLFPALALGQPSFDPGNASFGFYAISPTHTVYSEDLWNMLLQPDHASHAMRIYPVKNKDGEVIQNTYLVCMEEASNGDYNDYVFLVKNAEPTPLENHFTSLFNGSDFSGWYTFLESKGKNNDPENIFTVNDEGEIHDIGKELGYIMTEKSYGNYHFRLEFKWGEKRWPPRDSLKRDSGICYNIPVEEPDHVWPASVECQIQEGDVGDFWLIGYSTIQVDGKQNPPMQYSRLTKKKDAEKPNGMWNTVEVISFNGKCVHIVNGVVVNYGDNASLIGGKILLQSEYAEIFYQSIFIREL